RQGALVLALLLGFAGAVGMARVLDAGRPTLRAVADEAPYLAPDTARRLALGFEGLAADWYWLSMLQYIGRRIEESRAAGAAVDAFRRGANMTTARWMEHMADNIEARGDDPQVARAMYARMYEQAQDEQVKEWARRRLMELQSLEERRAIRGVLSAFIKAQQ